jgi:hypothetical protein
MWSYVQMWSPLLTIALAAAICFGGVIYHGTGKTSSVIGRRNLILTLRRSL